MNKDKYLTIYQLFLFHNVDKPDFRAVIHHIEDHCDYLLLDNIEQEKHISEETKHHFTKYGLTKYIVKQIKTEIKTKMCYDNQEDEDNCLPYKYNTIIDIMLWHDRKFPDDDDAKYGWGIMGHLVDKLGKSITPPNIGQTYEEFEAINGDWDWRFDLQSEYVLLEAMNKVNFTEENLSKIHISQFEQFLDNHNIKYKFEWVYKEIGNFDFDYKEYIVSGYPVGYNNHFIFNSAEKYGDSVRNLNSYLIVFENLLKDIYSNYVQGDLTQFHQLFTEMYNEIMSYPIKKKE